MSYYDELSRMYEEIQSEGHLDFDRIMAFYRTFFEATQKHFGRGENIYFTDDQGGTLRELRVEQAVRAEDGLSYSTWVAIDLQPSARDRNAQRTPSIRFLLSIERRSTDSFLLYCAGMRFDLLGEQLVEHIPPLMNHLYQAIRKVIAQQSSVEGVYLESIPSQKLAASH